MDLNIFEIDPCEWNKTAGVDSYDYYIDLYCISFDRDVLEKVGHKISSAYGARGEGVSRSRTIFKLSDVLIQWLYETIDEWMFDTNSNCLFFRNKEDATTFKLRWA